MSEYGLEHDESVDAGEVGGGVGGAGEGGVGGGGGCKARPQGTRSCS